MIVADACTIILLAKASVLEKAVKAYEMRLTGEVYREIAAGKEKMFPDALLVERLHNEKKVRIVETSEELTKKMMQDFNMGDGEASVIAAGLRQKDAIMATDNRQARKCAKIYGLSLVGSVEIVVSLYHKKIIDKAKAKQAITILLKEINVFRIIYRC